MAGMNIDRRSAILGSLAAVAGAAMPIPDGIAGTPHIGRYPLHIHHMTGPLEPDPVPTKVCRGLIAVVLCDDGTRQHYGPVYDPEVFEALVNLLVSIGASIEVFDVVKEVPVKELLT